MKRYRVFAVVNGDSVTIRRTFKTRIAAIDYMFNYYAQRYIQNFQIEEENEIRKHEIEYVKNDYNRFIVERVELGTL